jgi:hypothetical protein
MGRPDQPCVDDAAFRAAVMPFSTMVADVAETGYAATHGATRESLQDPTADSAAMAELAEQSNYAGVWDNTPVDTARTHICLLLTAGEDAMRTFASTIIAERTPLYAYIPLARAGLEYLALAAWLGEPGIGVRERVRRSLNERIASAYEQSRLPVGLNPEPDRQRRLLSAAKLGYKTTSAKRHRFKHFAPARPTITDHVKRVLEQADLGHVVYSYTSAISHGTIWGLIERAEAPSDEPGPVVRAGAFHLVIEHRHRRVGTHDCPRSSVRRLHQAHGLGRATLARCRCSGVADDRQPRGKSCLPSRAERWTRRPVSRAGWPMLCGH